MGWDAYGSAAEPLVRSPCIVRRVFDGSKGLG